MSEGKPRVRRDRGSRYWLVRLPGHTEAAYKSWRYAMTVALSWHDQDAAWRWYHRQVQS